MTIFMETTGISPERTVAEIQQSLSRHGASQILLEFEGCKVSAVAFRVPVEGNEVPFRLPCRWKALETIFRESGKRPRSGDTYEEWARRVAWRQVFRWVEAQFAFVETNQVKVQEVFLSYMQMPNGETLFERIESKGFTALEWKPQ